MMKLIQTRVGERNWDSKFILNMDQTLFLWWKESLKYKGAHCVNIRVSTSKTKCVTMVFTIAMHGTKVTPMSIFNGYVFVCVWIVFTFPHQTILFHFYITPNPNGKIAKCELSSFDKICYWACLGATWMDSPKIVEREVIILKPYIKKRPPSIKPLLYWIHVESKWWVQLSIVFTILALMLNTFLVHATIWVYLFTSA